MENKVIKKCHNCGFDNLEEANFCIKCGARLDQKIPCPKCGEYISNDEKKCPHCGKTIPHKSEAKITKNEQVTPIKARIARVFNRVSTFVTIALFALVILLSPIPHVQIYGQADITFPQCVIGVVKYFDSLDSLYRIINVSFVAIFAIDILVCVGFSIVGILKAAKAFKDYSLIVHSYKYLAVIIASKILTTSILIALSDSASFVTIHPYISTLLGFLIAHLSICIGFDCFLHFKRGEISIFIARIILGLGLFLPFGILSAVSLDSMNEPYGILFHFLKMTVDLINGDIHEGFISTYVLSSTSLSLMIVLVFLAYSLIVFFVSAYYQGMNKFKRFRIVYYMLVITLSIFASILLVSSIIEFVLLCKYLSMDLVFPLYPIAIFIYSALLVGVAITTFTIYNRARFRAKLSEKTTIVE